MTQTPAQVEDALFAKLREKFTDAQLVEPTATLARKTTEHGFYHAFGVESEDFTQGKAMCVTRAFGGRHV